MRATIANPARLTMRTLFLAALCLPCVAQTGTLPAAPAPANDAAQPVVIDRVVAVVNGELVLESDIDEERRFEAFQPLTHPEAFSRDKAIDRLVDRTLILQQARLQPEDNTSDEEVDKQIAALRKEIPACRQQHCETEASWEKFVNAQGFTLQELHDRWKERMVVLKFIELRFRMGIRITPEQIKDYYDKTLLPYYTRQKATPPKLETISDRIQEILLQQQVGALLDEWLKSLKAQGTVRMIQPGEVVP